MNPCELRNGAYLSSSNFRSLWNDVIAQRIVQTDNTRKWLLTANGFLFMFSISTYILQFHSWRARFYEMFTHSCYAHWWFSDFLYGRFPCMSGFIVEAEDRVSSLKRVEVLGFQCHFTYTASFLFNEWMVHDIYPCFDDNVISTAFYYCFEQRFTKYCQPVVGVVAK